MSVRVSSIGVLQTVAGALVAKQKYASKEEALKALALSVVKNKIRGYQRRIRQLEQKYKINFVNFTAQLQGNANPAEEDDWFAWRSAQSMLAEWQQVYQALRDEKSY